MRPFLFCLFLFFFGGGGLVRLFVWGFLFCFVLVFFLNPTIEVMRFNERREITAVYRRVRTFMNGLDSNLVDTIVW